jgi:hypothetical protein
MIADGNALAMNDDGVVAFLAAGGLYTSRRGRAPVFVADFRFPQGFIATNIPAISGDGNVAFLSCFVPGCDPRDAAIFTGRAGQAARLFVDAATFGGFVMAPAIDADGTVTFYGCRADDCGIFTGPDPIADVVVQESGPLLGAAVGYVCCFGPPFVLALDNQIINNRGRIVFAASLSDARSVIVRADPVRSRR